MAISDKRNKLKFQVFGRGAAGTTDATVAPTPNVGTPGNRPDEPDSYTHPSTPPAGKTTLPSTTIRPLTRPTVEITGTPTTNKNANAVVRDSNWGYMAPRQPSGRPTPAPAYQPPLTDQPFRDAVKVYQSGAFNNNPSALFQNTSALRTQIAQMGAVARVPILRQIAQAMGFSVPTQPDTSQTMIQWARNFLAQYVYRPQGWYKTVTSLVNIYGMRSTGSGTSGAGGR